MLVEIPAVGSYSLSPRPASDFYGVEQPRRDRTPSRSTRNPSEPTVLDVQLTIPVLETLGEAGQAGSVGDAWIASASRVTMEEESNSFQESCRTGKLRKSGGVKIAS